VRSEETKSGIEPTPRAVLIEGFLPLSAKLMRMAMVLVNELERNRMIEECELDPRSHAVDATLDHPHDIFELTRRLFSILTTGNHVECRTLVDS
jgi:hypothetical protein